MLCLLTLWSLLCVGGSRKVKYLADSNIRFLTSRSVTVVETSGGQITALLAAENVLEIGFSPRGTFIITWQRPSKDEKGDANRNLVVRKVVSGSEGKDAAVGKFVQKSQTGWNLQYTFDEKYCARVVTNEVQFYESQDFGTVWNKLRVEGVTEFATSPGENHSVAVFVPERKVGCGRHHYYQKILIYVNIYRAYQLQSGYSTFRALKVRCLRRISSKAIKSISNGIGKERVSSSLPRRKWTSLAKATMAKPQCTS